MHKSKPYRSTIIPSLPGRATTRLLSEARNHILNISTQCGADENCRGCSLYDLSHLPLAQRANYLEKLKGSKLLNILTCYRFCSTRHAQPETPVHIAAFLEEIL